MPTFTDYTKQQLEHTLATLDENIYTVVAQLDIQGWTSREPIPFILRADGVAKTFKVGDKWGDLFDCAWFRFTGRVPLAARGKATVALLDVNGEMCVFSPDGVPQLGLTNVSSSYDSRLGTPGKRVLPLLSPAAGNELLEIWAEAGCNDLFGELKENGTIKQAAIATCNETVRALYYDFEVLLDFLKVLPENSPLYRQILFALTDTSHLLSQGVTAQAEPARARLAPLLARHGGEPALQISAVGHAHMDLAWLWPIRETIRKGARTFATALANIEKYPGYIFGASQPQYFQWIKEYYPALYARIKTQVAAGRIEPQGALWVESDTNLPGGEALVRQILLGRRFFRQEFDRDVRYAWLPDVFGYNGNLPQILKKSGIEFFATQKLSWSLINHFPHHSFYWQGIDGSTVLAHLFPEDTYNSPALPRSVRKIEENYRDSGVSGHALMVYGIGDGGGGPGEEHLERLARIGNLAGLSPVRQQPVTDFFAQWRTQAGQDGVRRFATWVGELYLERHQGTLTTQGRSKWYNRKVELGLRDLEWSCVLVKLFNPTAANSQATVVPYPAERLQTLWREALLYQFHDILPGSSIKRVYDESLARYQDMYHEILGRLGDNDRRFSRRLDTRGLLIPLMIQNSLSWERSEWVLAGDRWLQVKIPSMGYAVVDVGASLLPDNPALVAESDRLENEYLRVRFDRNGNITSLVDKRFEREIVPPQQRANRFAVYTDLGDAWDFPLDYAEQSPRDMQLIASEARIDGPRAILKQVYRLGASELSQEVILVSGSPRLDFVTRIHWREVQCMLRVAFPLAVHADEAAFDIQFGHIRRPTHRNTTWDLAHDEVAAHKWVDVSQRDFGVALLNDAKYGHKVKQAPFGNVIDLNLLRSVPYPGPRLVKDGEVRTGEPHHAYTDQAEHHFTYALYPHPGDLIDGRVIQAAYELNVPLRMMPLAPQPGELPRQGSFLRLDRPNVLIEAVKQAEDGEAIVVRLYEATGASVKTTLYLGFEAVAAEAVDLMEENPVPLELVDHGVVLDFHPFEIKTVKVITLVEHD
ncbi:MAG: alpha-mannosidase [Chloroflexota bacterium]